jgi:hypothetical protein
MKAAKAAIAANERTEIERNLIERKRNGRAEQEAKQTRKAAKALKRANCGDDSGRSLKKELKNEMPYFYQSPVCSLFLWSALSVERNDKRDLTLDLLYSRLNERSIYCTVDQATVFGVCSLCCHVS